MLEFIWYALLIGSIVLLALEILFCVRGIFNRFKKTDDEEEESTDV